MSQPRRGTPLALMSPDDWPEHQCCDCPKVYKTPVQPREDDRCGDCQEKHNLVQQEKRNEALRERDRVADTSEARRRHHFLPQILAEAGCPKRYARFTKPSWEQEFGKQWTESLVSTAKREGKASENLSLSQILEALQSGDEFDNWLLFLYGSHGRRKTSLATAMLGELLCLETRNEPGKHAVWQDFERWIDAMEWGLNDRCKDEEGWEPSVSVYKRLEGARVLLIDDLGAVRGGRLGDNAQQRWWQERIANLLRYREAECLTTIITSNVEDIDHLGEINHSLPSRIKAARLVFKIGGRDFRI